MGMALKMGQKMGRKKMNDGNHGKRPGFGHGGGDHGGSWGDQHGNGGGDWDHGSGGWENNNWGDGAAGNGWDNSNWSSTEGWGDYDFESATEGWGDYDSSTQSWDMSNET